MDESRSIKFYYKHLHVEKDFSPPVEDFPPKSNLFRDISDFTSFPQKIFVPRCPPPPHLESPAPHKGSSARSEAAVLIWPSGPRELRLSGAAFMLKRRPRPPTMPGSSRVTAATPPGSQWEVGGGFKQAPLVPHYQSHLSSVIRPLSEMIIIGF